MPSYVQRFQRSGYRGKKSLTRGYSGIIFDIIGQELLEWALVLLQRPGFYPAEYDRCEA